MYRLLGILAALCILGHAVAFKVAPPTLLHSWNFLNFTFRSQDEYNDYLQGDYKNCMLAGVKVSTTGELFVSVPRWREGVPATLNKVEVAKDGSSILSPFPSWEANKLGDPMAFQSVLGFEIDSKNRMWVLDQGKVNGSAAIAGAIKLVVLDLTVRKEIARYIFNGKEASRHNSFLNDIVVDTERDVAYITDSGLRVDGQLPLKPALIVYDLASNSARRVLNMHWSVQPNVTTRIIINGESCLKDDPMMTGADGIALSADFTTLYWTPLTSHFVMSISTELLRNASLSDRYLQSKIVTSIRDKRTAADGMACSNEVPNGVLYVTSLDDSSVRRLAIGPFGSIVSDITLAQSSTEMMWPDTLAFDHRGNLLFVSNGLHRFLMREQDYSQVNFRIWSVPIGVGSYNDPQE